MYLKTTVTIFHWESNLAVKVAAFRSLCKFIISQCLDHVDSYSTDNHIILVFFLPFFFFKCGPYLALKKKGGGPREVAMPSVKLYVSAVQLLNHMTDFQETHISAVPLEDTSIINVNIVHILTCEFEFHFCRLWNNKIVTKKFCCCFHINP